MTTTKDRRFDHPFWFFNPYFAGMREYYEMFVTNYAKGIEQCPHIDAQVKEKLTFYSKQALNALCPANFPFLNPLVFEEIARTNGKNLIDGLSNFLKSCDKGTFQIPLAEPNLYKLGKDIAATPGVVVARESLYELIYYPPANEQKYNMTPILIVPSWINKFYILDLTEETSFINWCCQQGAPVFILSWINPRDPMNVGFYDYMKATVDAFHMIYNICSLTPHMLGYCVGGFLMSYATAYLAKTGKLLPTSLTYMASPFDFELMGDLKMYIQDFLVDDDCKIIDGLLLRNMFINLRTKDLLWPSIIDHYYLGKNGSTLPIFYWNDDPMNVFADLHKDILQLFCKKNTIGNEEFLSLNGEKLDISNCCVPVFILGAIKDHIVPWQSCYAGTNQFKGPVKFVLAQSGHVGGIVNHPSAQKYGYYSDGIISSPEIWLNTSNYFKGSWWPHWFKWLQSYSLICSDFSWETNLPSLGNAPGEYVHTRIF